MKKLFTVFTLVILVLLMTACMQEEDYFTRDEVEILINEALVDLNNKFEAELNELDQQFITRAEALADMDAKVAELEAELAYLREDARNVVFTIQQRYVLSMLDSIVGAGMYYTTLGQMVTGTVENYDYAYIIIELDEATDVQIELLSDTPESAIHLNIYYQGDLDNSEITISNMVKGTPYYATLGAGFNTLELDSYISADYDFIIKITRVV